MKGKYPKFPLPKAGSPLIQLHKGGFDQLEAEESQRMQLHMDENTRNNLHRNNTFRDVLTAAIRHHGLPASKPEEFLAQCRMLSEAIATEELRAKWESLKDLFDHMHPKVIAAHLIWSAAQVGVDICERLDAGASAPAEDIRPRPGGGHPAAVGDSAGLM